MSKKEKSKNSKRAKNTVFALSLGTSLLLTGGLLTACDNGVSVTNVAFYSGTENPTAEQGKVGDFYFETDTCFLWQYKNEGWEVVSSLKGPKGDQGEKGEDGQDGQDGLNGRPGKSAYEIALDHGFVGDEAEWIASLEGRGVLEVEKTTQGNVDTYTIYYTDGTNYQFTVTNGQSGTAGSQIYNGIGAPTAELGVNGDYYFRLDTKDLYSKANGEWQEPISLKGEQGDPGVAGSRMYSGSEAPATANVGDYFLNSTTGALYEYTAQGWSTDPVAELKGPQGSQGEQGDPGVAGSRMYSGTEAPATANIGDYFLNSETGALYEYTAQGWSVDPVAELKGPQGSQGEQGEQGVAGSRMYSGTEAPATANVGDYFLNSTTGALYEYTAQGWSTDPVAELKGPQGDAGAAGSQIHNGTGAPSADLGVVGDYYFDTEGKALYTKLGETTWSPAIALQGNPGEDGVGISDFNLEVNGIGIVYTISYTQGQDADRFIMAENGETYKLKRGTEITTDSTTLPGMVIYTFTTIDEQEVSLVYAGDEHGVVPYYRISTAENLATALQNGACVVTITDNIEATQTFTVENDLLLNLNGNTITVSDGNAFNLVNADVAVFDNSNGGISTTNGNVFFIANGSQSSLMINGGTLQSNLTARAILCNSSLGEIMVNGGSIIGGSAGIETEGDLLVNDATLIDALSSLGQGIRLGISGSSLVVNNGTIHGGKYGININNYNTAIINGGTISGNNAGIRNEGSVLSIVNGTVSSAVAIQVLNGEVNILDGTFAGTTTGIDLLGTSAANTITVNVMGGTISGQTGIKFASATVNNSLTINGATITATNNAIDNNGGIVSIDDATITSETGYGILNANRNVNNIGTISITDSSITGATDGLYNKGGIVTINDGSLTGTSGYAIRNYNYRATSTSDFIIGTVTVAGSTVVGGTDAVYNPTAEYYQSSTLKTNGDDPSVANPGGLVEFVVTTESELLTALSKGAQVKLTQDILNASSISLTRNVTIDLNGNTLNFAGADTYLINNASGNTATVKNGLITYTSEVVVGDMNSFIRNSGNLTLQNVEVIIDEIDGNGTQGLVGISNNGTGQLVIDSATITTRYTGTTSNYKPVGIMNLGRSLSFTNSTLNVYSVSTGSVYGIYDYIDNKQTTAGTRTVTIQNSTVNATSTVINSLSGIFAESYEAGENATIINIGENTNVNVERTATTGSGKKTYALRAKGNATINGASNASLNITDPTECTQILKGTEENDDSTSGSYGMIGVIND